MQGPLGLQRGQYSNLHRMGFVPKDLVPMHWEESLPSSLDIKNAYGSLTLTSRVVLTILSTNFYGAFSDISW